MPTSKARNHFFKRLVLFALIFAGVAILIPGTAGLKMKSHKFNLPDRQTILFIGDSHIAQGVDDSVIPGAFNSSVSADSYLTAFLRLKLIIRDNPQIHTVFLGVSPYSISQGSDETIFRPSLVAMKVPYYAPHFEKEEVLAYLKRTPKDFFRSIFLSPTNYLRKSKLQNKKYFKKLGDFNPRPFKSLEKAIANTQTLEKPHSWGNYYELTYLKKICALCKNSNVDLIFLNTPIYNAEQYLDIPYYYATLKNSFSEIECWDYMNLSVPDEYREDINHLNEQGARFFAQILAERIKREIPLVKTSSP